MIISVSGTPGTGKTEVARVLAKRLGWKLIELNALAEEKSLYAGYDESRKCKIVDVGRVKDELDRISKRVKNIVAESHYAHDMNADIVVMLRTNPRELRKRLLDKNWSSRKIEENIQSEIMEVCKTEALEQGRNVMEIDTTGKSASNVVEIIMKKLKIMLKSGFI